MPELTPARALEVELRDKNLGALVGAVVASFKVSREDILGYRRDQHTVRARTAAIYIGSEIWGYSRKDLGQFFNRTYHAIEHLTKAGDRLYKENPVFRQLTDQAVTEIWPTLPEVTSDDAA